MRRAHLRTLTLLVCLFVASPAGAEEEGAEAAFPYDAVDVPIETVIQRATSAGKPIFIEFSTEG